MFEIYGTESRYNIILYVYIYVLGLCSRENRSKLDLSNKLGTLSKGTIMIVTGRRVQRPLKALARRDFLPVRRGYTTVAPQQPLLYNKLINIVI